MADSPLTLSPLTTGEEPQILTFLTEISAASLSSQQGTVSLLVDGNPAGIYETTVGPDGFYRIAWNTVFDTPIMHALAVNVTLATQKARSLVDSSNPNASTGRLIGKTYACPPQNLLYMKPIYAAFDTVGSLPIYAELAVWEATYAITFRDESGVFLGRLDGSTIDGTIDTFWNMIKPDGTLFNGPVIKGIFEIWTNGIPGPSSTIYSRKRTVSDGDFTTAYAYEDDDHFATMTYNYGERVRNTIQLSVVDLVLTSPLTANYNSTYNQPSPSGIPGHLTSAADVQPLINNLALPDTRNFHWDGHGTSTTIGNANYPDDSPYNVDVFAIAVAAALDNRVSARDGLHCNHPYRYVFLNCCEAMSTLQWANAFGFFGGIDQFDISRNPYCVQGMAGWVTKEAIPGNPSEVSQMAKALDVYYSTWMFEMPLETCLKMACSRDPYGDGSIILEWPLNKPIMAFAPILGPLHDPFPYYIVPKSYLVGYPRITRSSFAW